MDFWRDVAEGMGDSRAVFAARCAANSVLIDTVQMIPVQIEKQLHRAEIAKMMVHRSARKQGVGGALMRVAQDAALAAGRPLLVLDTASDDAARHYMRLGWTKSGSIPNYARLPDGRPCATHNFYKDLTLAVDASKVLV